MPKFTKEFSDSIGFKSLGHFTSFVKEFNVIGAQIQNLFDEYFKKTCFESYQLIANKGIDPHTYQKKEVACGGILSELRSAIPIKKVVTTGTPPSSPTLVTSPSSPTESVDLVRSENPSRTRERLGPVVTLQTDDYHAIQDENVAMVRKLVEQENEMHKLRRENELLTKSLHDKDTKLQEVTKDLLYQKQLVQDYIRKLEQFRIERIDYQKQISSLEMQNTHHKKVIFSYKKDDEEIRDFMRKRLRQ